jgi:predicted nucleotidyltransferase
MPYNGAMAHQGENVSMNENKALTTAEYISSLTERIVAHCDPLRIILFGSVARGESGPDSDIDLLVVLSEVTDKRKAAIDIRRKLSDLRVGKDIVVTTPDEIARRGHLVGTILRPALREGKVLYERV